MRYGNVMSSRGSVIPFFLSQADKSVLPITDARMTHFIITLEEGFELVWHAFDDMGGLNLCKKIPSMNISDVARASVPDAQHEIVYIRLGEKLHEQMIGFEDAPYTYEYAEDYKILPAIHNWSRDPSRISEGKVVNPDFTDSSYNNLDWMSVETLTNWIAKNREKIGKI